MRVVCEEVFGPVAPIIKFGSDDECISLANNFRVRSSSCSQNLSRVWRILEALEFGIVGINSGVVSIEVRAVWWREAVWDRT